MARLPVAMVPVGPVSAGAVIWRRRGELRATVVVKAVLALVPDGTATVLSPDELVPKDRHVAKDPVRAVEHASELAPNKARADVTFVGRAYAPAGRAVTSAAARLAVFRGNTALVDKTVHVYGERDASGGGPRPFQRMELGYERAWGGPGVEANPIGTGAAAGSRPPNVVWPANPRLPVGFGPTSRYWPARRKLVAAEQRAGLDAEEPEVPEDVDWGYFQSAPTDQQTDFLRGDEWIVLDGLSATSARVTTRLPGIRGAARWHVRTADGGWSRRQTLPLVADTLHIDGEAQRITLVWRGHLSVPRGEAGLGDLLVLAAVELPDRRVDWPDPTTVTAAPEPHAAGEPARAHTQPVELEVPPRRAKTERIDLGSTVALPADAPAAGGPALPFAPAPAVAAPVERKGAEEGTRALSVDEIIAQGRRAPLPFAAGTEQPPSHGAPADLPGAPWSGTAAAAPAPPEEGTHVDTAPPPAFSGPPLEPGDGEELTTHQMDQAGVVLEPPATPLGSATEAARWFHAAARNDAPAPAEEPAPPRLPPRTTPAIPIVGGAPLVAFTLPWQIRPPRDSITVVVKGSFDLVPGGPARLREETEMPCGELHLDDEPSKSLATPGDFAVFKPKADVVVTGRAWASGGKATHGRAAFSFGAGPGRVEREIAVFGDRTWKKALLELVPSDPEPFESMPLVYERAFGGPKHPPNPVGIGRKGTERDGRLPLPNLEVRSQLVTSPGDTPPPACFAPIAMGWRERWSKLGTYDRGWLERRWPYFPEDFDWTHFQSAPSPQQVAYPRGDEPFELVGMHRVHGKLVGTLPGIVPRCFAAKKSATGETLEEVVLRLDTVHFDVEAMRLDLVWRGFFEASDDEAPEVEALFVTRDPIDATPAATEEIWARFHAAATPLEPVEESPSDETEPANDDAPLGDETADAEAEGPEQAVRAALRAAGVEEAPPPAPPPPLDPAAYASAMREAGADEADVAAVIEALTAPDEAEPAETGGALDRERVVAMLQADEPLDGLELSGLDLSGLDFSRRSLAGALMVGTNLATADLTGADLTGAELGDAVLTGAVLAGADLTTADLTGARVERARFAGATLVDTTFASARGAGAVFDGAKGARTQFESGDWTGASFARADLAGADFTGARLDDASFEGARIGEIKLYDARGARARFDGAQAPDARCDGVELVDSSLRRLVAPGSVWERARLEGSTFLAAELDGASFSRARCAGTVFSAATLKEARFRRADLRGAQLMKCDLMMATFERADLTGADLRGANLHAAETWKAELAGAQLDLAIVTKSKLEGRA